MIGISNNHDSVRLGGFNTAVITRQQLALKMVADCKGRRRSDLPKLIFSSNGQGIAYAARHAEFADAMRQADLVHADGMSVVHASRIFSSRRLPERVATTDFFHDAAVQAADKSLSFFFLGGREDQNRRATDAMQTLYPGLRIAGRHHGYFGSDKDAEVCRMITDSGADVLWLGLGKPRQELWAVRNRERLRGVGWIKTCGGLFGYLAGDEKRAQVWIQNAGLEWLYRTIQSPDRLLFRYLVTNPYAAWRLAVDSEASFGRQSHRPPN